MEMAGSSGSRGDVVAAARLRLVEKARRLSIREFLTATLDEAEALTGSRIGFLHFVSRDERELELQAWSTNTTARMCTAEGAGQHYPVDRAGIWADCIRFRRPVVHDDYLAEPGKKGMPAGHAPVTREAVVPVLRDGRVCAAMGVGNKEASYTDGDVAALVTLADQAWDLAERMRAEEALRRSERRLDLAVRAAKVGLWDLDLATGKAWRTLRHDQLFGYDELLPEWGPAQALEHVVPEDRKIFLDAFDRAMETGRVHYELRVQPQAGPLRWLEATGEVVRDADGRPSRMTGTVADVTERKVSEEAVRRSEILYRAIAHHYPRGVVGLFGADHRLLLLDGERPILAATPSAIVGKRPSEFTAPEVAGVMERLFAEALAGQQGTAELRVPSGVVVVRTHPIRDEAGKVAMGLVVSEDVTEERAMQAQVQASARLAALGTLVAGVAHEINNPLAAELAAQGSVAEELVALRDRVSRGDLPTPEEWVRQVEEILEVLRDAQAGGQRIARIVRDLALLGRQQPRRARVRVSDVVEAAMRWLPASAGHDAAIRVDGQGGPEVMASEAQLVQVLVNLVSNGVKAIPSGRRGTVTVRFGAWEGRAFLEVVDDGEGIPPEVQERIFDPFFTTRDVGQGMGLGLPVCHAIVQAHGGTLAVSSTPGEGSTFRVQLPLAP